MLTYFVGSRLFEVLKTGAYLRIMYASTALIFNVHVLVHARDPTKYFCKDNAIAYNYTKDGK